MLSVYSYVSSEPLNIMLECGRSMYDWPKDEGKYACVITPSKHGVPKGGTTIKSNSPSLLSWLAGWLVGIEGYLTNL